MYEDILTHEVRDLILKHIDSVAQLEALLFLRTRPTERWSAAQMAKALYAPGGEMKAALDELCRSEMLVRVDDLYGFDRTSPYAMRIDALAEAYARHLIPITNLIHSKPRNIRAFSDAFKIRKD